MGTDLLEVWELRGGYGDITVIEGFSASLRVGEVVFITGRNGTGKSTLVKLIAGQLTPSGGQLRFNGQDLLLVPQHKRLSLGIGYAPQEAVVFDGLSVEENLTLHYDNRELSRYDALFDAFPRLPERLKQNAGTLSGGEKKILSFCRAMAEDTKLVILDEPTEGVQPENIAHMAHAIDHARSLGRSLIVVEQNLSLVEQTADRAFLLDNGRCIYTADANQNLRSDIAQRLKL